MLGAGLCMGPLLGAGQYRAHSICCLLPWPSEYTYPGFIPVAAVLLPGNVSHHGDPFCSAPAQPIAQPWPTTASPFLIVICVSVGLQAARTKAHSKHDRGTPC